jgi:FlgN protein
MSNENITYLELLEQRIELFNSLSASLLAARSAMVAVDIDGLELRIAQQREICGNIEKLDEQIERIQYQCAAHLRMHAGEETLANTTELEDALHRLHQAQARVKELNASHQTLLKRSRRTVTALLNSLHTFEGTYQKDAIPQAAHFTDLPKKV